ncbi:MAG: hypothetical protein M3P83_09205 [Actinomycetota bacterium]|nr:hypothetical protein [Actinomycetota bacterium]
MPAPVDPAAAAVAGLIAGQLMEVPAYLQRLLHRPLHQDVFAESGLLLGVYGRGQRLVGYLGHAGLSVIIALAYAAFFRAVGAADQLLCWGLLAGLVHFTIGGLVVAAVFPAVDPSAVATQTGGVGFAYASYGQRDVLTFLGGHLLFGLLVGLLYPALHPALPLGAALGA